MVAFASFMNEALTEHATVVFPAESYAEKEGTVTHPDGRLQRVRQSIGRPGEIRAGSSVLIELCERLDAGLGIQSLPGVTEAMAAAVPFYAGITLEEIGGQGVRWQDRDAASAAPDADVPSADALETPPELPEGLRLGSAPSLWEGPVTRHAPALRFLEPHPRVELSPADAERLGIASGDEVVVSSNGHRVRAPAALRSGIQPGSVFMTGAGWLGRTVEVTRA